VVFQLRGEGWAGLGITTRRAVGSVILSCLLAALSIPALLEELRKQQIDIVPHILFNALVFWEVLFVYGWLQLRLERAFGYLAAIPLTAIAFAGYHVGSMDTAGLTGVFVAGLVFSAVFAWTRNLLVLFPLAWAVSSSIGTLMGGFAATWETVLIYVGVFLLQIILLRLLSRHRAAADGAAALN
jgi:hypothetical protein